MRMSVIVSVAVFCAALGVAGTAAGQMSVTVEAEGSVWTDGEESVATPGCAVDFRIRYTNNSDYSIMGGSNGFRIGVQDAAGQPTGQFQILKIESFLPGIDTLWNGNVHITEAGVDGVGWDTIGFAGFAITGQGLPPGFDEQVLRILVQTGPAAVGNHLCIDSAFFPPVGTWLWASPYQHFVPSWGGPYCWRLDIPLCGVYAFRDTTTSVQFGHCDLATYTFNAYNELYPDQPTRFMLLDGPGEIADSGDSLGLWTWQPTAADIGHTYTLTVEAAGCGECAQRSIEVSVVKTPLAFAVPEIEPIIVSVGDTAIVDVGLPAACYQGFLADDGGAPDGHCFVDATGLFHFESDTGCRGLYSTRVGLTDLTDTLYRNVPVLVTDEACILRGNVDGDMTDGGAVNMADLTWLVSYVFIGGLRPTSLAEGDVDGMNEINVADVTYLASYLFQSGPPPPPCR